MRRPRASMDAFAAFVSIAEHGRWTKAAEQLGVTVSGMHKRLRLLADLLGAQLIETFHDRIRLTEAGELFYREAVQALEHATLAEEKAQAHLKLRARHILMGHSTYLPPKLLAIIHNLKSDVAPSMHIEDRTGLTIDLVEQVMNGTLHVGIGFLPIHRDALHIRKIFEEPLVACIPSSRPLASRAEVGPQDLAGEPFIAVARQALPALHAGIEEYCLGFGIELQIVEDAFSPTEALAYVEQKVGICLLAVSSAVAWRGVTVRPLSTRTLSRRSGIFLREDNRNPILADFIEIVLRQTAKLRRVPF
jgi:DNA-binding transcriptional LysR family regulator